MLIAYDTTGTIVATSGTNSVYPDGPADAPAWLLAIGRSLDAVQVMRLNDQRDAELVDLVLQGTAKIRNGRIIEVDKPPVTSPPVDPAPEVDVIAQIAALQAWAKDIQNQVDATTEILMGGLA